MFLFNLFAMKFEIGDVTKFYVHVFRVIYCWKSEEASIVVNHIPIAATNTPSDWRKSPMTWINAAFTLMFSSWGRHNTFNTDGKKRK